MSKTLIFVGYMLVAILASGLFGMLHDQISYTVSPEYFTKFKFLQFRLLNESVPERIRAAQVGWLASWWMGIPLGILSGGIAFIHKTPKLMLKALSKGLLITLAITFIIALIGLLYGMYQTSVHHLNDYQHWYLPKNLNAPKQFIRAGFMHNAAYLGAIIALPITWLYHLYCKKQYSKSI